MRRRLSVEAKEAIIKQALGKSCRGVAEIAEKNKVGYSTLQKWLRAIREERPLNLSKFKHSKHAVSRADYLNHLLATVQLDETALGDLARKRLMNHILLFIACICDAAFFTKEGHRYEHSTNSFRR